MINTLQQNEKEAMEQLISKTETALLANGADKNTVSVITKESIPLAYLPNAVKLKVKLCGAFSG